MHATWLQVVDGGRVEEAEARRDDDPILEWLEPEPELEHLPEQEPPRPNRRRRSFLSHLRRAA